MPGEVVCTDGCGIEIAKSPESAPFCMMSGRTHQGVSDFLTSENAIRCGQGTIDSPFSRQIGIMIDRSKGVNTIIAGPDGQFARGTGSITDWKYIGIDRFI